MGQPEVVTDPRVVWDAEAATFDDEPHHSLADPLMRSVWWDVLEPIVPPPPARIADLGCGTGSLSVLLAERGHSVVGVDVSPCMLERAEAKARRHGVDAAFVVGDAADLVQLVRRPGVVVEVTPLDDPALWGHVLVDTRYVLVATT